MAAARDGCVVATEPLSQLLSGFVADWNRTRPSTAGRFSSDRGRRREAEPEPDVSTVGAVAWVAAEAGLPKDTVQNVVAARYRTTELRVADPIVTAIGRPEAFHDGTLEIMPNPNAPAAARAACCGGSSDSLTGSF